MKINKKSNKRIILFVLVLLFFIYIGHFFISVQHPPSGTSSKDTRDQNIDNDKTKYQNEPVIYLDRVEYIKDKGSSQKDPRFIREVVNILEVDITHPQVAIRPVLSHDFVYGFELLSSMATGKGAYAAINGGFYSQYGLPSGMVVIDGELITMATGKFPVLIITKGKAEFVLFESKLTASITPGSTDGRPVGKSYLEANVLNSPLKEGEVGIYTPVYGSSNRAETENLTITVKNGTIENIGVYQSETLIPKDGFLITFAPPFENVAGRSSIVRGDNISFKHLPEFIEDDTQAYECGSMIIKDGVSVIGEWDQWVGILTNRDPRTAIGIKKDGKVVLITVDGRQPGYSEGMTGQELAEYLLSLDVVDAAMLDGGASTVMLVEGNVVNRPSFKGQERPLAGGILVYKDKYN